MLNDSDSVISFAAILALTISVTGLVVVDTGHYFSWFGKLVMIVLIQIGGLGIMTLTTLLSVAVGKRINLRERLSVEACVKSGEWGSLLLIWLTNIPKNFIMALPFQLLIAGPLVRKVFRTAFPEGTVLLKANI